MTDPAVLAAALDRIADPTSGRGLILSGRAAPPRIEGGTVDVLIDVTGLDPAARAALEAEVRAALAPVPGVATVRVALTAERAQGPRLIAVASGKGGVGKSTVAANLAVALARLGVRTGLIDADIYGPSQTRLMQTDTRPEAEDSRMIPTPTPFGVAMLSMGQLIAPGQAIAWRGPMVSNALGQMVDAHWGDTAVIIVDLPPGTGDVQLSMIQKHRPAGAVIVSTPQDLALIDAARAIDLFDKAGVPVIGLVENMAGYVCPSCGAVSDPFGTGGAEAEAATRNLPFLGRVPLSIDVRRASDAGEPPAAGDTAEGEPFRAIAARVAAWLNPAATPAF
ncbi:Mrp/NBP35 family ATP-binding protein [Sphingomonas nostoxanthinifaciens]|uniref:Mrp/NBP35 family ATP-binding protein n=1 Tax=Sphingomonas nostoxanthinifaciens TaxID=2872652 RepID=UPI001CC1C716|nr:Mrp/NBP35 family ATP-binding protein [Sphingomonas nostoxanthinifaciens]UAK23986.1 Mrp/NBP35 family ATP-binding protein [Sphingomonas nostoxanthinifaciens]